MPGAEAAKLTDETSTSPTPTIEVRQASNVDLDNLVWLCDVTAVPLDASLRSTCDGDWDRFLRMGREDAVEYMTEEHQNSSRKIRRTMSPNI